MAIKENHCWKGKPRHTRNFETNSNTAGSANDDGDNDRVTGTTTTIRVIKTILLTTMKILMMVISLNDPVSNKGRLKKKKALTPQAAQQYWRVLQETIAE